jgi:hypothetical protein
LKPDINKLTSDHLYTLCVCNQLAVRLCNVFDNPSLLSHRTDALGSLLPCRARHPEAAATTEAEIARAEQAESSLAMSMNSIAALKAELSAANAAGRSPTPQTLRFHVQSLHLQVQGSGLRGQGLGHRVQGLGHTPLGFELRASGLGCRQGSELRQGLYLMPYNLKLEVFIR